MTADQLAVGVAGRRSRGWSRAARPSWATRRWSTPSPPRSTRSTRRWPTGSRSPTALAAASAAADAGRDATTPLVARKGRASYLGERSAGHQDPGATSTALLLAALAAVGQRLDVDVPEATRRARRRQPQPGAGRRRGRAGRRRWCTDGSVRIAVAAGLDETTFGTDAVAIKDAIEQVDGPAGVVVLMDLGSAVLSAELALDLLDDPAARDRVRAVRGAAGRGARRRRGRRPRAGRAATRSPPRRAGPAGQGIWPRRAA